MPATSPLLPCGPRSPAYPAPPTPAWRPRPRLCRTLGGLFLLLPLIFMVALLSAGGLLMLERTGHISFSSTNWNPGELATDPYGWGMGLLGGMTGLSLSTSRAVRGLRVAVVEPTAYHSEVLSSVLAALDDLGVNVTAYTWVSEVGYTSGDFRPSHPAPRWGGELTSAVEDGEFDVVILNTCDAKFWEGDEDRFASLEAIVEWASSADGAEATERGPRSKYDRRVVCLPHEIEYYGQRAQHDDFGNVEPIAQVGRLDYVALATHAANALRDTLGAWSEHSGKAFWERASRGVESFVPVFPFPDDMVPPKMMRDKVHKAGIIGRISQDSRDYNTTFRTLERAILANPPLWGYNVVNVPIGGDAARPTNTTRTRLRLVPMGKPDTDSPNPQRVPDYSAASEAFTLHLTGYVMERPVIPPLLTDPEWPVVRVATYDSTTDFYRAIRDMDVILPAFSDDTYYHSRASASIPAAIMAQTPLLVTSRHLEAYAYLSLYPASHVLAPRSVDPIAAIGTLRRGEDPWDDEFTDTLARPTSSLAGRVLRTGASWDEYLGLLRKENTRVWARVLARAVRAQV